jgi:uncharacterized membrane protein HdeD (DUF308 family)
MYFRELNRSYTTKVWYLLARGLITAAFGVFVLLRPPIALNLLFTIAAIALIVDAVVALIPILRGQQMKRLAEVGAAKAIAEIIVALILLSREAFAFRIFSLLLALLILFRGILEFITFVEADARVKHQRLMLLMSVLFIGVGVFLLFNTHDEAITVTIFGIYCIFEGVTHCIHAWRFSELLQTESAV